jgi:hypothetical protein
MSLFGLNRRRSEALLLMIGQLVLIAYVFQVAAFDHWNIDVSHVAGIPDSSAHTALHDQHCHGDLSSCTGSGGGFAVFSADNIVRLPEVPPMLAIDTEAILLAPVTASPLTPTEPPRIAI